ncbi:hypothetical protein DOTSEDRAFT_56833 [Dothistroma septosporum NZE10]|uniref:Uncharacterized protein n=1 Tax=Dothistroma septosporum (strain NZE10 / CBS 128990) TaxID=675120 RepID=M2XJ20_DOTSN|nr:hypothetical protein DOTSEDRAFT_56833 [Dothistroma septosporum NZE10]
MYFAVHVLPPAQRQRSSEHALRTVPVPIEGDKTFADLLQGAQARFEAISSPKKNEFRFDTLADKHGAEMFASDKIESLFGSGQPGMELFLYTSKAFKTPPKPVRKPATTKGEPAFKRRRLAPQTPDSNAEAPTEDLAGEHAEDPIEDFDDYELPASSAFSQLNGSQRKERTPSSASASKWRTEEDKIVMEGMKHGWSMKMVLAKLPGYDRTASAVRSRRKLLREKPERKERPPSKVKLRTAPTSSSEGKPWSDGDVSKLEQGRAEGLDNHAIHEKYFSDDRTLEAVSKKLSRIDESNAMPSSSVLPPSTQSASSPAEAALARRQSPIQMGLPTRMAYVQLPVREEVAAQLQSQSIVAPPHVRNAKEQDGIFRGQPESERWRMCLVRADGDEEKAKRVREDMQSDMDMINAVAHENQDDIEEIKARRVQTRLRRAVADGRARRKNRRTPRSGTLVPSTEMADEEVLRESDWEILEEEDVAETNGDMSVFGDEERGNDNDSSEDEVGSMVHDRQIEELEDEDEVEEEAEDVEEPVVDRKVEEVEEEEDHEPVDDLALLQTRLVESTPVEAETPSSNAIPESELSIDKSTVSVRTDEGRSKRARRRSRSKYRAGASRSRSRTNSFQGKSDADVRETLADDEAFQTVATPSPTTSKTGKLPTLRQRILKSDGHTPARKARPSAYDVLPEDKKTHSSPPRLAATAAFIGTLSRKREDLFKNKDWMPPPPKKRDPKEFMPKRKANGDPLWFESDDGESSSSSDSE